VKNIADNIDAASLAFSVSSVGLRDHNQNVYKIAVSSSQIPLFCR